jgi:outer membrane lipoprotein-sorting protein
MNLVIGIMLRLVAVFGLPGLSVNANGSEAMPMITSWLSAQTNIHTWSANVTQTRSLKTLTQSLIAQGRVWFAAPNRFRWEIGNPPTTIALRQPTQMLVIYPKLKRAERYPLNGQESGAWKETLALLEAGFPSNQQELNAHFKVASLTASNEVCEVILLPKSAAARRMMPQIKIVFGTNDYSLRATELQFGDGSTMRNDFSNPVLNPKLEEDLFTPKLESDFKIVEPLKKQ